MFKGYKNYQLTAINPTNKTSIWKFACDCGNVVERHVSKVKTGHTKSCGCRKKTKVEVGFRNVSKSGLDFEVVEVINCRKIKIRFDGTGYISYVKAQCVFDGRVMDRMHPSVYGIGYLGDGPYKTNPKYGDRTSYGVWSDMLRRCYVEEENRNKAYKECEVASEWHNFQNFAQWFYRHYREGYQLDKDLFAQSGQNKVYSPETCCFLPAAINSMLADKGGDNFPKGVDNTNNSQDNPFRATIYRYGTIDYLGAFPTEDLASKAYKKARSEYLEDTAFDYLVNGLITDKIYDKIIEQKEIYN